jgi:hypothetical protein
MATTVSPPYFPTINAKETPTEIKTFHARGVSHIS